MTGRAFAIANNDIVHIAWSFDEKIPGCTGFSIYRITLQDGSEEPLRSLPTFVVDSNQKADAASDQAASRRASDHREHAGRAGSFIDHGGGQMSSGRRWSSSHARTWSAQSGQEWFQRSDEG